MVAHHNMDLKDEQIQQISDGMGEYLSSGMYNDPGSADSVATQLDLIRRYPGLAKAGWSTDKIINRANAARKGVETNARAARNAWVKHIASDEFHNPGIDAASLISNPDASFRGFQTEQTPDEKAQGIEAPILPNINPKTGRVTDKVYDRNGRERTFLKSTDGNFVPAKEETRL